MAISMGEAEGKIKLDISGFQKGFNDVKAQSAQLDSIAAGMGKAFDAAAKAAKIAFAAITAASAAAVKQMITAGSSFEASMSQVAATMGMTADEINNNSEAYQRLSNAAKEAGASSMYSASQSAQALNYLALAGYSVEDSIKTLPTILNVAAAGGMDLASASDMVTDAMSALGLSVDEAASFADKLAKTSQKSNTNIAQLGAGILQIGGTAKSLAGGVDELNTALGILANNGIKAAEGGTALRQIILNLTAPTEKAAAYMEEIGLSAYDAAGNMKPLNQIFAELDEIMSQFSTQKEKDNILTQIFDARQLKSARALLSNYGDSWDNLYEQISSADGAAQTMAETMQQNLQGAMTIAKSAIEAVQVSAYEGLQKGLTQAVQTATASLNKLNAALSSPETQNALNEISNAVGYLITQFAEFLAETLPKIINAFSDLDEKIIAIKSVLAATIPILAGVALNFTVATEAARMHTIALINTKLAQLGLNAALLANPYVAVAAALTALTVAISTAINETIKMRNQWLEQNNEMTKFVTTVEEYEQAFDKAKSSAKEMAEANNDEIDTLNALVKTLGDYADKTQLSAGELKIVESTINKLNELFPENTAEIKNGQITGYEDLAEAVSKYTEELKAATEVEALTQLLTDSEIAKGKAAQIVDTMTDQLPKLEAAKNSAMELADAQAQGALEWTEEMNQKAATVADVLGISVEEYKNNLDLYSDLADQSYQDAVISWSRAKNLIGEADETISYVQERMEELGQSASTDLVSPYEVAAAAQRDAAMHYADTVTSQYPTVEKMWEDLAELDRLWQLRLIDSEDEYQKRRKEILETNRLEYDDDWIKEYNKSLVYQENQQEQALRDEEKRQREAEKQRKEEQERQKEAEKQRQKELEEYIEGQWENFETRHKNDVNYTEKMMIDDMEKSLEVLEKDSDLYKELSKEVSERRSDWVEDERKKQEETAESNFEIWQDAFDKIQDEADSKMRDIKTAQDNLTNSLVNSVKLYETKTLEVWNKEKQQWEQKEKKVASSKAIKDQTKELTKYMDTLDELKAKGLSENVMAQILGMSAEDGAEFAKQLNNMTQSELKEYSNAVDEMTAKAQQFSADFYAPQREKAKEDYDKALAEWKKQVPDDWQKVGEETINGFIKGIEEKAADGENAASGFIADSVDGVKKLLGIHSPSTVFAEIGENVVAGLINGVNNMRESLYNTFTVFGENSANKYIEGFKSVWESFANSASGFMAASNEVASSLAYTPPNVQWGNNSNRQNGSYSEYASAQSYSLTKSDITSAVKAALPERDVVVQLDSKEIARASINRINSENLNSGGSVLKN